ncbi:26621_t:CDS:2, partial [Gigaspora margarita]
MNQYPALYQLGYMQFINHEELYFENNPILLKSIDNETFNKHQHEYASYENPTKYITQNTPVLRYLGMIELENCSAESITNNLERFIIAKSLNIENLSHFGSDRAKPIKETLLEEAANNQQAASLLANINQEFKIAT